MNTLELKGFLLSKIAKINEENILVEIKKAIVNIISDDSDDFWDELSEETKQELNIAIEESKDEKNWTDHDEVLKTILND